MKIHAAAIAALLASAGLAHAQITGPSTTTSPYVLPNPAVGGAVTTTSIFTVGDTINGYRMVGIPDGLGAFSNNDGSFTLTMNHELGSAAGIARSHGSTGAFVSRWTIGSNLQVLSGRDHNTGAGDVNTWNGTSYTAGTAQFNRFCSADLAAPTAFRFGNLGTDARIHMNGEEAGTEGRAFAHVLTGAEMNTTWQLPALGRFSWENSVPSPFAQQKTIVMGTDDSSPGEVYMYVGNKTDSGNTIERAGLTNGNLYGVRVSGLPNEDRNAPVAAGTRFDLFNHGDVTNSTGAQIQTADTANSVTRFLRPEDGAWDPRPGHENEFYFVTTDRFNSDSQVGRSRLYRMSFDDIANPEAGGTITPLLTGTEGGNMFDNICIDSHGRILLQEDIGGQNPLGKIWLFDTNTSAFTQIAAHSAEFFTPGLTGFLTSDEESSGIIDAGSILGDGWFLLDVQAHYPIAGELVEGGQLLAMYVDPSFVPAPGAAVLLGIGGLCAARRRR